MANEAPSHDTGWLRKADGCGSERKGSHKAAKPRRAGKGRPRKALGGFAPLRLGVNRFLVPVK
jgi:hypothetical protein